VAAFTPPNNLPIGEDLRGRLYQLISADLSYCNRSRQKKIQDSLKHDSPALKFNFLWRQNGQRVSSRLFDYHQGDKVTRMLQQLTEGEDSTGTSLFLQVSMDKQSIEVFQRVVEFTLVIYRGPLP